MATPQEVKGLYQALLNSGNIRMETWPAAAAGVAMVSDGAVAAWAWAPYVEIIAAANVTDPAWLAGVTIHTGVVETCYGDLAIATGAGAAEVDIAIVGFVSGIPSAVGVAIFATIWLPFYIRIAGQPRLAGRIRKDTAASAAGFTCKAVCATALGT